MKALPVCCPKNLEKLNDYFNLSGVLVLFGARSIDAVEERPEYGRAVDNKNPFISKGVKTDK